MLEPAYVPRRMGQVSDSRAQIDPAVIEAIVRAVLANLRGEHETALLCEVKALAVTLSRARAEIAAIDAGDINASHIPSATDELDAIVVHTAAATDIILNGCENLDALGPSLDGHAARAVQDVTTQIYEACGFQDITGQRINKIVGTLQSIERKVAHIIAVFGHNTSPPSPQDGGASLLHGPQMPAAAMDQTTVDALLASLE